MESTRSMNSETAALTVLGAVTLVDGFFPLTPNTNLPARYGLGTSAIVTSATSEIGREYAFEL